MREECLKHLSQIVNMVTVFTQSVWKLIGVSSCFSPSVWYWRTQITSQGFSYSIICILLSHKSVWLKGYHTRQVWNFVYSETRFITESQLWVVFFAARELVRVGNLDRWFLSNNMTTKCFCHVTSVRYTDCGEIQALRTRTATFINFTQKFLSWSYAWRWAILDFGVHFVHLAVYFPSCLLKPVWLSSMPQKEI